MARSGRQAQLRCLPQPLSALATGDRSHEAAPPLLAWQTSVDGRVQRFFDGQFVGSQIGTIAIEIDEIDSRPPQLGNDESYELTLAASIKLRAKTTWGALRGLATLYQLEEFEQLLSGWRIVDEPRFAWRGLMIDVARHFIALTSIREVIDGMAVLKLNTLHLHLSDDQGFRFASHAYPKLASRECYSPSELVDLVAYAADRGIRVVAELDVPGHVTSWLEAYPQWGFGGGDPTSRFGVHRACLDVTSDEVLAMLGTVFAELTDVFPDQYVHIGGDEVHARLWQDDAGVQEFMRANSLANEQDLQNHFNGRLCEMIGSMGRTVIGWDEVLHSAMPRCVVQNWRGATTRDRTLALGLDSIVSAGFYLDLCYPSDLHYAYDPQLPQAALIELEDSWRQDLRLEHVAAGMAWTDQWRDGQIDLNERHPDDAVGRVLGGEACLWGELVDTETLPIRLWSRLPAVAERLWSSAEDCDVESLYERLPAILDLAEFRWVGAQARGFDHAGLKSHLAASTAWFEPTKWYGRLLGETALRARLEGTEMPQARPYDTTTRLRRVVDFLPPESLPARSLASADGDELQQLAKQWSQLEPLDWPQDMHAAVAALRTVGLSMADFFREDIDTEMLRQSLLKQHGPHGEYMLAVVPAILVWLSRG